MTEDDRFKVTGQCGDAPNPGYPFTKTAPDLASTWIVLQECEAEDGRLDASPPQAWGTAAEYVDHLIEVSEVGDDEIAEMREALCGAPGVDGANTYVLAGFVGGGFLLTRVEGPEEAMAFGASSPAP